MSIGLKVPSSVFSIDGIRLSATNAGLYAKDRLDLALIEIVEGSSVSAVFTKNLFCAAPVQIAKQHLEVSESRYCLINAGNANAGTGQEGINDANETCQILADHVGCLAEQILPFSTGVIGEELPVDKVTNVFPELIKNLSADAWIDSAEAIMTTDTVPKAISTQVNIHGSNVNITGIAKGSGMIKPNMATMLSFVATDANVSKHILDEILDQAVNKSFNRISVDGDTSTNDACVLIATGKANHSRIEDESDEIYLILKNAIDDVLCKLAQAIVRDGEGATKYIEIEVSGGESIEDCLSVAYKIAESPLVKTAFTASDPNWGRILAAVGNANTTNVDIDRVNIYLDDLCIVEGGQRSNSYTEDAGKKIMLQEEIKILVKLAAGTIKETIWTTDLSHEYIRINAEYRT